MIVEWHSRSTKSVWTKLCQHSMLYIAHNQIRNIAGFTDTRKWRVEGELLQSLWSPKFTFGQDFFLPDYPPLFRVSWSLNLWFLSLLWPWGPSKSFGGRFLRRRPEVRRYPLLFTRMRGHLSSKVKFGQCIRFEESVCWWKIVYYLQNRYPPLQRPTNRHHRPREPRVQDCVQTSSPSIRM